ncbi:MAG: hypothetical protein LUC95_05495 [Lachnospiraceae bacterium]|nr:hypothetical protein [Lachnospiraceae bacterium]
MASIMVTNDKITYRKLLKPCEIALDDLQWAYLQKQDIKSRCCCGSFSSELDSVIVLLKSGKKEMFQFESMDEAKDLLAKIQAAKPDLAVGYTPKNRALYEKA